MVATAGSRLVQSRVEERPTTQVIYEAVWGGRHADDVDPGDSAPLIEGEPFDEDRYGLPAGDDR